MLLDMVIFFFLIKSYSILKTMSHNALEDDTYILLIASFKFINTDCSFKSGINTMTLNFLIFSSDTSTIHDH